jgi:hypothetical protein
MNSEFTVEATLVNPKVAKEAYAFSANVVSNSVVYAWSSSAAIVQIAPVSGSKVDSATSLQVLPATVGVKGFYMFSFQGTSTKLQTGFLRFPE